MVAGAAVKYQMDGKLQLQDEQEIITNCSDMMIDILNAESLLLRIEKQAELNIKQEQRPLQEAAMKVFLCPILYSIKQQTRNILTTKCCTELKKQVGYKF